MASEVRETAGNLAGEGRRRFRKRRGCVSFGGGIKTTMQEKRKLVDSEMANDESVYSLSVIGGMEAKR